MSIQPVTLKALAARAAVHPSTISRVANRDPLLRIAPATRARIEALLQETQYRPNGVARSLKLRQTFVLAVVIPDITNELFSAIYRGVEDAAGPRGYSVILCNTDGSADRERSHLQVLQGRRVDGIIVASATLLDPAVAWLRQQALPHVLVNRFSDEQADPFVGSDDRLGGELATRHLLALGHRRVGHAGGSRTVSTAVHRRSGYLAALGAAHHPADPALMVEGTFTEEGGARAAAALLDLPEPPTAIFAVNDLAALGVYEVARQRGLRIPEQLAVVGYNDILAARRLVPALTTVRVPVHEFGRAAADMLIDQVENGRAAPDRIVFPPELIVRDSTQPRG